MVNKGEIVKRKRGLLDYGPKKREINVHDRYHELATPLTTLDTK